MTAGISEDTGHESPSPIKTGARLKVFCAQSFDPDWRPVVDGILAPLSQTSEIDLRTWNTDTLVRTELARVSAEAGDCDALVGVITSGSTWPATEAIIHSLDDDARARVNLYLFVEKTLEAPVFHTLARCVVYFERSEIEAIREQQRFVVYDLLRLAGDYSILKSRKKIRILRDGFGIVTYIHSIRVTNKPNNRVLALSGSMGLTPDVIKRVGHGLPLIREMSSEKLNPLQEPTFTCRVLSRSSEHLGIKEVIESNSEPDSSKRDFLLILDRPISPGEVVQWGWGFTFPKLYTIKGHDSSTYKAPMGMESPEYEVEFELERTPSASVDFDQHPVATILDASGREKTKPIEATAETNLCFVKYVWRELPVLSAGDKIIAAWVRS